MNTSDIIAETFKYYSWDKVHCYCTPPRIVCVIEAKHWRWHKLMVWLGLEKLPYIPKSICGAKIEVEVRGPNESY